MTTKHYNYMDNTVVSGIRFPKETIERLDKVRGYYSRNKLLLKITEEYLNGLESQNKGK